MNLLTLVLSYTGSAPALLFLTSIFLVAVNQKPAVGDKKWGVEEFFTAVSLMLCLAAILVWMIYKLYLPSSANINWWHLSWSAILLVMLTFSIKRRTTSLTTAILLFVPLGFVCAVFLSFLSSKAVSGLLAVSGCITYGVVIYRKAQYRKKLSLKAASTVTEEPSHPQDAQAPVDPAALESRLKSQEANEGADKYTRE
jgi:hypothetical protein